MEHSESKGFWFSDLDVIWCRPPEILNTDENLIYAQNDAWKKSGNLHFCSGIMFFPNSQKVRKELSELFEIHVKTIESKVLTPDEPIFNSFFVLNNSSPRVNYLDSDKYVIGHRIIYFLISSRTRISKVVAFHINYVIGDQKKSLVAMAILSRLEGK